MAVRKRSPRGPLSAKKRKRMRLLLSPYAYVPTKLPRGFIYIEWQHRDLMPAMAGELLTIGFAARRARQIIWTSSRGCDPNGVVGPNDSGYPGYGYGMIADRNALIAGRRIYFSQGTQSSNAWTYIRIKTPRGADFVAVGIRESNCMSPKQAMRLVAHARRA